MNWIKFISCFIYPSWYGNTIYSVDYMRDLGVNIDANLKLHSHTNSGVLKANRVLSVIVKSFINLSSDVTCDSLDQY